MLYRSTDHLSGLLDAGVFLFIWLTALGATSVVIHGDVEGVEAVMSVLLIPAAGYLSYQRLWCLCVWVRLDTGALEWATPLSHGWVPLDQVRQIARESRRIASIDIRGQRSLFVRVRPGLEDFTSSLTASAPHVKVVDNR